MSSGEIIDGKEAGKDKDEVMEDAGKCQEGTISDVNVIEKEEEEELGPAQVKNPDDMVLDKAKDAKCFESGAAVEHTDDIEDGTTGQILAGSNGISDNVKDVKLNSGDDNGDKGAVESNVEVDGKEKEVFNDKNDSSDVSSLNDKSLDGKAEHGEKCDWVNDKGLAAKAEDGEKEDKVKDKPLEAKAEDGEKKNEFSYKASKTKAENGEKGPEVKDVVTKMELSVQTEVKKEVKKPKIDAGHEVAMKTPSKSFLVEPSSGDGFESGTEEEQAEFLKDVETFYRLNNFEFKPPKFYKEELNLLKLWRAVIKLGGYEQVTSCKLWRQVGESFRPPKTCTTVSWTFRIFYEKALLEYEKYKMHNGELPFTDGTLPESVRDGNQAGGSQAFGSGRARRDAATRAMQGWHSRRLLDNGQVCQPIIKDKSLSSTPKVDKQQKTNGLLKRKKPSTPTSVEHGVTIAPMKTMKQQGDTMVIDIGPPADWVKINVQRTNDCFEIYALVPGLLREEVHVQSDPAGRLIISGQPEQLDNPWGVTPFKKVVSLPSRIDPHQTSAVVTLHGQLFVRVPFEQSDI